MHEDTPGMVKHHTGPRRRKDELEALKVRLCMSVFFTLLRDCEDDGPKTLLVGRPRLTLTQPSFASISGSHLPSLPCMRDDDPKNQKAQIGAKRI
jgi:hypothetical protein